MPENPLLTRILEPLAQWYTAPGIEEIAINRPQEVWVKRVRGEWEAYKAPELTYDYLANRVCYVLANVKKVPFDRNLPIVATEIAGKRPEETYRFQGLIGPNVRYEPTDNQGIAICVRVLGSGRSIDLHDFFAPSQTGTGKEIREGVGIAAGHNEIYDTDPMIDLCQAVEKGKSVLVSGPTSTGKAQPVDEPVLTPDGWRAIGSLTVGDRIYTQDGSVTTVTGVFPQGMRPINKVTFADGRWTRACDEHLWQCWGRVLRRDPVDSIERPGWDWTIKNTSDIRTILQTPGPEQTSPAIPMIGEKLSLQHQRATDLHPYVIGSLIGAAWFPAKTRMIVFRKPRPRLLSRLKELLPKHSFRETKAKNVWQLVRTAPDAQPLVLIAQSLGINAAKREDKRLPEHLIQGSSEERLELLRGLVDSLQSEILNEEINVAAPNSEFATDIQKLVWSLGGTAKKTWRNYNQTGKPRHSLTIKLPQLQGLLKKDAAGALNSQRLRFEEIQPDGTAECVCISVEHHSQLYVTRNFIITHNTTFLNGLLKRIPINTRICTFQDTLELDVPHPNRVMIWAPRSMISGTIGYGPLLDSIIRLTPDVIIASEISIDNAQPIARLLTMGHACFLSTIHAGSCDEAIEAFVQNMALKGGNVDQKAMSDRLRKSISRRVQIDRFGGERSVTEIQMGSSS